PLLQILIRRAYVAGDAPWYTAAGRPVAAASMRVAFPELLSRNTARPAAGSRLWPANRALVLRLSAAGSVVLLAASLRSTGLPALGSANHYSTAAAASLLQSWHNFFFVAAEPGGAVSVDKPPLGLWVQAGSALLFGVDGFALLLPEVMAGVLSVAVLFQL